MTSSCSLQAILVTLPSLLAISLTAEEAFEAKVHTSAEGKSLNYRIHLPANMDAAKRYPLVLFFHGAGERGTENTRQLIHGARDFLAFSAKTNTPAIIVAPQCPPNEQWVNTPWSDLSHTMPPEPSEVMRLTIGLLRECIQTLPVDSRRVYVTGLSIGGFGTWDIIQRHPEIFAAAMPICGGGDTALAPKLAKLPIWVFHGDNDTVVKTVRSRDMVAAIEKAGGKPRYTEYPGVGHNAWSPTYGNGEVLAWLFSQKKSE
ncbi:MAG: PHB depolymerase family esterase [Lentisphaeria bacterium]|jgi:predicted peptidase|nr:PHB depolymerase family esterase [Lentisphaeria bacterium]